jgi:hypothetical protein
VNDRSPSQRERTTLFSDPDRVGVFIVPIGLLGRDPPRWGTPIGETMSQVD